MNLKYKSMITNEDYKLAEELEGLLYLGAIENEDRSTEYLSYATLVAKMRENLKIAPKSYREATSEEIKDRLWTAECNKCGWWGSSILMSGGAALADTGDYEDCNCPVCGEADLPERINKNNVLQPIIIAEQSEATVCNHKDITIAWGTEADKCTQCGLTWEV